MISNDTFHPFAALDFEHIKLKLMHKSFGEGWSEARAIAVETEYRRFLYLHSLFPKAGIVPTIDVDTFWHYHILDTANYAADCEHVFGYFLHHYPYLGLLDDDEPGIEIASAKKTRVLYEAVFGATDMLAESDEQSQRKKLSALAHDGPVREEMARCQMTCGAFAPPALLHSAPQADRGARR